MQHMELTAQLAKAARSGLSCSKLFVSPRRRRGDTFSPITFIANLLLIEEIRRCIYLPLARLQREKYKINPLKIQQVAIKVKLYKII
jgi:hypothetical protein